ncbi:MAG: hypothetical protein ACLTR6_10335 [Clostridium fessum]
MEPRNLTLLTDLYELTMMQGYFREKDANETVIFDAFYRTNPDGNAFSICAGLEQVIDYVKNLHFDDADIEYFTRTTALLMKISRISSDISNFSTVTSTRNPGRHCCLPREPLSKVIRADQAGSPPSIETAILNIINHQSLIADHKTSAYRLRRRRGRHHGVWPAPRAGSRRRNLWSQRCHDRRLYRHFQCTGRTDV